MLPVVQVMLAMGSNKNRLHIRALARSINNKIVAAFILLGFYIATAACSIAAAVVLHFLFLLPLLISVGLFYSTLRYLQKAASTKEKLEEQLYSTSDKQYVWDIERDKDKLLARMIQEHVCPWQDKKCSLNKTATCKCLGCMPDLIELGLDPTRKDKIKLNECKTVIP